ncbi:hypothetical protein [Jidongwangia harbinensis]|uniref:hypothetical protein n=1 Tax=Jidongwangia harbinensis TaxID=2878561 RepID=UPI001CD92E79|nr:hypothetical protein [Jidongwangia harbinensis]MCA2216326.1 hypothetical protein [Jidongwangia harbinensis]MCA2217061.1 hypothetical protein [Jidongwangia harbinensis]
MILRRLLIFVVLLQILPLAACSEPSSPAPAVTKPFDAMAALAASTSGIDTGSYRFVVNAKDVITRGLLHAPSGTADLTSLETTKDARAWHRARIVGGKRYLKTELQGGKWDDLLGRLEELEEALGPTRKKQAAAVREVHDFASGKYWRPPVVVASTPTTGPNFTDPDAVGMKRLLSRVRTAQGSPVIVHGTLDATGLAEDPTMIGAMARRYPLSGAVHAMPFRATLDSHDRIHTVNVMVPGSAEPWTIEANDYGGVRAQVPPAADEVRKPSALAQKLLGDGGLAT